jgi:hypothetical protein
MKVFHVQNLDISDFFCTFAARKEKLIIVRRLSRRKGSNETISMQNNPVCISVLNGCGLAGSGGGANPELVHIQTRLYGM